MAILPDTSIWVEFFRGNEPRLQPALNEGKVKIIPVIIGEIACGNLKNRSNILFLLGHLPHLSVSSHQEQMQILESKKLYGKGIGIIDLQILCAALLGSTPIWTRDKSLQKIARSLDISWD